MGLFTLFGRVYRRDLTLSIRSSGQWLNTLFFFVIVVSLFPLGIGPGPQTLATIAPGIVWVSALLSMMLSLDSLFAHDFRDGTLEQMVVSGQPLTVIVIAKVLAHWTTGGLPLVVLSPLLGLVSVVAPALAMGNRITVVASEPYPLTATDFYQVLDTSDVPGGVVNILTGSHAELTPQMAGHMDADAVWSFSGSDLSKTIELEAARNIKRTWVNNGAGRDWTIPDAQSFLSAATETKTIWVPYGE